MTPFTQLQSHSLLKAECVRFDEKGHVVFITQLAQKQKTQTTRARTTTRYCCLVENVMSLIPQLYRKQTFSRKALARKREMNYNLELKSM